MSRPYRHPLSWRSWPFRAVVGLIVSTLAVRLAWGWWLGRKAEAELAKVRARGEPVRVEDVAWERLPDSQNAAVILNRAGAARVVGVDSPRGSNEEYGDYLPLPPVWHKLAGASEAAHGPLFSLVRQARSCPRAQFGGPLKSPMILALLPHLNPMRDVANIVSDGAISAHVQGNDREAMERLFDTWHIAQSLRQDDWVISELVAMGVEYLVCDSAQLIAPALSTGPPSTQPATRQQVTQLIRELLDEEPAREGLRRSFVRERVSSIDYTQVNFRDSHAIGPLADATILHLAADTEIYSQAARCPAWPEAQRILKQRASERTTSNAGAAYEYSRCFAAIVGGNYIHYCERHFRNLAERRITAISLAARLHWLDHGAWPGRLEDLVPQYLPTVPRDPFVSGDKPMGYMVLKGNLRSGRDRPLVYYEAGPDRPESISPTPMYGWQRNALPAPGGPRYAPMRQYRDLSRFEPPPSTQAVDGDQ